MKFIFSVIGLCLYCISSALAGCRDEGFPEPQNAFIGGDIQINSIGLPDVSQPSSFSILEDKTFGNLENVEAGFINYVPSYFGDWINGCTSNDFPLHGRVEFYATQATLTSAEVPNCAIKFNPTLPVNALTVDLNSEREVFESYTLVGDFFIPEGCLGSWKTYSGSMNFSVILDFPDVSIGKQTFSYSVPLRLMIGQSSGVPPTGVKLSETDILDFGTFLSPATSGSISIEATNDTPVSSGIRYVNSADAKRGAFRVSGAVGTSYSVSIDNQTTLHNQTGSTGTPLTLSNLHTSVKSGTLQSGGDVIYVGGTLQVPAKAAAGTYEGTYSVNLNY